MLTAETSLKISPQPEYSFVFARVLSAPGCGDILEMEERTAYVYCLKDPVMGDVMYVGNTAGTLEDRKSQHVSDARRGRCTEDKDAWIVAGTTRTEEAKAKTSESLKQSYADGTRESKLGVSNTPLRKPVLQYDQAGNFIAEHKGMALAAKAIGAHRSGVENVIKGKRSHTKGFVFKLKPL